MTWDRLRASPATSLEIVLGKAIPRVAMVLAQFVVVLAAAWSCSTCTSAATRSRWSRSCVVFSVSLVLLGVAVTAICRTAQQANSFAYVGMVLFGAIGGALVPFNVLPPVGPDGRARLRRRTGRCAASAR